MPVCAKCKKKAPNLVCFSFPSNEELRKKWIDFLDMKGYKLSIKSKLCAEHFTEDSFVIDGKGRLLKDGSIPSIQVQKNSREKDKRIVPPKTRKKCILCGNNSKDLSYFSVPKVEEMKQKWEKFCEFDFDNKNYSLCHLHFKPSVIRMEKGRRILLPNAIPSIYFDDYQFEFIPVRKSNDEDTTDDVECIILDPTVINTDDLNSQNSIADPIISIDYSEYNTPPRTPITNNSTYSKKPAENSVSDDIVNIFIPSYEDSVANVDSTSINDSAAAETEQNTIESSPVILTANGSLFSAAADTEQNTTESPPVILTANGKKKRMFYPGDFKSEDINSLDLARTAIENFQQIINRKNKTIKVLSVKARRLAIKNAALKETIRQLRAEKKTKETKEKEDLFEVKGWWDS